MLDDSVFDAALNYIKDNTENLYILKAAPTAWADIATHEIGKKEAPSFGVPESDGGTGRKIATDPITDGNIYSSQTATHFAITDDSATKILVSDTIDPNAIVVDGNMFALTAIVITFPGVA